MVSLTNFRSFGELAEGGHFRATSTDKTRPAATNLAAGAQATKLGALPSFVAPAAPQAQFDTHTHTHTTKRHTGKMAPLADQCHFEIRWSNLTYKVEPKWYQRRWAASSGSIVSSSQSTTSTTPDSASSAAAAAAAQLHDSTKISSHSPSHAQHSALHANSAAGARNNKKIILDALNGAVRSGEVTAILGPSGAGKTSLLGCLTGKHKSGVSGCVQVINTSRVKPMSICTIPQRDYLLNQLTVRENLWFASRLKNPQDAFDHDTNIERVVELLKLDSCIDTKISKISGGQYKRVSIAQELLSNPDILILDEPTSGLDSLTCYKTVLVLRDLARLSPNPMAIIVTIHQPQREVFDLFNHVYILAIGGRCIYEGHPAHSIKTINECSGGLHFDTDQYNPASYLVEIASAEFGEKPIESLVENQRHEFIQRTMVQDYRTQSSENLLGLPYDALNPDSGAAAAILMPGQTTPGLRKRQSPMMARFRSTLSNLASAASPKQQHKRLVLNLQHHHQRQEFAYLNEAYDSTSQAGELQHNYQHSTLSTSPQDQLVPAAAQHGHQQQQQQRLSDSNYPPPPPPQLIIDASRLGGSAPQQAAPNGTAATFPQQTLMQTLTTADGELLEEGEFYLDERLQTHKHDHKGHFLRHCKLLTKRSWLCLCKDPMLTTLRFTAHILVPLLITIVYGSRVGKPNACPIYESEMDLIDYAKHGAKRLLQLQEELRWSFENVGLYFLSVYAFTFSTMCLTSLSFPLSMHVLLKEVRNGWYSIPTYFIGKTVADFPLEFILPTVTLMITYPLTGQPSSAYQWRFFVGTGIFVITSLIAQTQGLIFGALFMNAMQAAVFVAPVSTTPLILLSGFLIRIGQMPIYLQKLALFSYFRYAIEALTITRYGFGQCECDPTVVTGKPVSPAGVPNQLRTMTNYWLSTFESSAASNGDDADSGLNATDTANDLILTTTTIAPSSFALVNGSTTTGLIVEEQQKDFFQDLTQLLARANSFGTDIRTCKDLKPYPMIDFSLEDEQLYVWVFALFATLFASKVINYIVVKYSVKWRL